jgi:hypothetical protein
MDRYCAFNKDDISQLVAIVIDSDTILVMYHSNARVCGDFYSISRNAWYRPRWKVTGNAPTISFFNKLFLHGSFDPISKIITLCGDDQIYSCQILDKDLNEIGPWQNIDLNSIYF